MEDRPVFTFCCFLEISASAPEEMELSLSIYTPGIERLKLQSGLNMDPGDRQSQSR